MIQIRDKIKQLNDNIAKNVLENIELNYKANNFGLSTVIIGFFTNRGSGIKNTITTINNLL